MATHEQLDAMQHLTPEKRERLKKHFPHGTFLGYRTFGIPLADLREQLQSRSGYCHRFWIESFSVPRRGAGRAVVAYSNPDEYGSECPVYVSFPCIDFGCAAYEWQVIVQFHSLRCRGGRDAEDRDAAAQAIDGVWFELIDEWESWTKQR